MNIQWHEGMLLSPHHFQQMNNQMRDLLHLSGHIPFNYGFFEFKSDDSALSSGVIRILRARGIFQDGTYFDFDALNDPPLEKNLSDFLHTTDSSVKIYLGIRAHSVGEDAVTGNLARYYSTEISVKDENSGENSIQIPVLKPKLQLLLENEVDARFVAFPIAEMRLSDGGIENANFIPPFITVDEYSQIAGMCRDIVQSIRSKVTYFADRKDNLAQDSTDVALTNLRLLIKSLLPMEAIIHTNNIHPFDIYKCVLETTSDIIATNPPQLIPKLPPYNHNDLYSTFHKLIEYIEKILSTLKQKYYVVRFEKEGPLFKLDIKPEWLGRKEIAIGVQRALSSSDNDVLNWISSVQIASESMLQLIKDRRITGAERRIAERGSYITQPNGTTIIFVQSDNSYIKPAEKLCLVNYSYPVVPDSVVLYAEN